jgi:hypothetical protein
LIGRARIAITTAPALAWTSPATIDTLGNAAGPSTSLAVAPSGKTYVAWEEDGSSDLYLSQKTSSGWNKDQVAGQKWTISSNSDGTYTLVSAANSLALDVAGCGTTSGGRPNMINAAVPERVAITITGHTTRDGVLFGARTWIITAQTPRWQRGSAPDIEDAGRIGQERGNLGSLPDAE